MRDLYFDYTLFNMTTKRFAPSLLKSVKIVAAKCVEDISTYFTFCDDGSLMVHCGMNDACDPIIISINKKINTDDSKKCNFETWCQVLEI